MLSEHHFVDSMAGTHEATLEGSNEGICIQGLQVALNDSKIAATVALVEKLVGVLE